MTDKIPAFKSEIDNIHVPIDKLDEIISQTVQRNAPKRKKSVRKKFLYTASAAVVAFGLLVGSATVSPVMANIVSHIPLIGSIFSVSEDRGLVLVNKSGLTHIVGESQTVEGITLTIDEVFYDDTRLTFGYSLESKHPLEDSYVSSGFTVDGKRMGASGIGGNERVVIPTYRTYISSITTYGYDLPEEFDLGLSFEGKGGEHWEFTIPIRKHKNVRYIAVDHTQHMNDIEVTVSELKSSSGGLLLTYQTQSISRHWDPLEIHTYVKFKVVDSTGNELVVHDGSAIGSFYKKGTLLFDPPGVNATNLTITPYIDFPKQGEYGITDWDGNVTDVDMTPYQGKDFIFDSFTVSLSDK